MVGFGKTYSDIIERYRDLPYLHITCSGVTIRTYYLNKTYESQFAVQDGILPITSNSARELANTLNDLVCKCNEVDLQLYHPDTMNTKKKNKLYKMTGDYLQNDYKTLLLSYLLLLI